MKRRELLTSIGVGSATFIAGCTALSSCDDGATTIETAKEEYDEDSPTLFNNHVCVGGSVTEIDNHIIMIEDSTGIARIAPLSEYSELEIEEGDCISVCGERGGANSDEIDIYISAATVSN